MKKIISELADTMSTRASSPFLLAFFISWIPSNYRLILTILSSESYRAKFYYIDTNLYNTQLDAAISLFLAPFTAAIFYTFIWPFFDTEISAVTQHLKNRKQARLLQEQRKEPIDRDEQALFFDSFDKQIEDYKNLLNTIHNRESHLRTSTAKINTDLTKRLRRQALLRMAEQGNIGYAEINNILNFESWAIHGTHPELLSAAKKITLLTKISEYIKACESINPNNEYKKIVSTSWLASTLKFNGDVAFDFLEILFAINLAIEIPGDNENFEVLHNPPSPLSKIHELVSLINKPD